MLYLLMIHINFCLVWIGSNVVSSQQTFYLVQIEENEKAIGKVAEIAVVRSKVSCYARYVNFKRMGGDQLPVAIKGPEGSMSKNVLEKK